MREKERFVLSTLGWESALGLLGQGTVDVGEVATGLISEDRRDISGERGINRPWTIDW